jgi:hypothetical protein
MNASIHQHTSAYVSIRQHTSAYASIRQHTSAYVSIPVAKREAPREMNASIHQHMSAYVSICQHTPAYVSIRQNTGRQEGGASGDKRQRQRLACMRVQEVHRPPPPHAG